MNEAILQIMNEAATTLTSTKLTKIETEVPGYPNVKIVAYWCGTVLRLDIKGVKA